MTQKASSPHLPVCQALKSFLSAFNLQEREAVHRWLSAILEARGIHTAEQVEDFLHPEITRLYNPFLMKGMREAVQLILDAVRSSRPVMVYGDYDADGVNSTALMVRTLQQLGAVVSYYIPDRFSEGYGLNAAALKQIAQRGYKLVLTVDTGISGVEEAVYAKALDLQLVITDHHEPPAVLPQSDVIVNPKQPGCSYPFPHLAGVGVAFKLAQALLGRCPRKLLQYVAVGTIADLMPLLDENRILVSFGLKELELDPFVGYNALKQVAGLEGRTLSAEDVGFILAPRLNASGRLAHASGAYRLLVTENAEEAQELAHQLERLNRTRQRMVDEMVHEAEEIVEQQSQTEAPALVVWKDGWNPGVIGIVASRMVEKHHRPAIVFSVDRETGLAKGSARGVDECDVYRALFGCQEWLDHFGGHPGAAGMTLRVAVLENFRAAFIRETKAQMGEKVRKARTLYDLVGDLEEVSTGLVEVLNMLGPFGVGNPQPKVLFPKVWIRSVKPMGKGKEHLRLELSPTEENLEDEVEAVAFRCPEWVSCVTPTVCAQLVGRLTFNEWRGRRKLQIVVDDLQIDEVQVFDFRYRFHPSLIPSFNTKESFLQSLSSDDNFFFGSFEHLFSHFSERESKEGITDLVLLDLPHSLSELKEAVLSFPDVERVFCIFAPHEKPTLPARADFVKLYRWMQSKAQFTQVSFRQMVAEKGLHPAQGALVLNVFLELGFIRLLSDECYAIQPVTGKHPLENSYQYLAAKEEACVQNKLLNVSHAELQKFFHSIFDRSF